MIKTPKSTADRLCLNHFHRALIIVEIWFKKPTIKRQYLNGYLKITKGIITEGIGEKKLMIYRYSNYCVISKVMVS